MEWLLTFSSLFNRKEKTLNQSSGTIYLTSHRLIYVDALDPHFNSCYLDLNLIRQTECYAGFLKSSPKVTLFLSKVDDQRVAGVSTRGTRTSLEGDAAADAITTKRDWRSKDGSRLDDGNQLLKTSSSNSNWVCGTCGFSNGSISEDSSVISNQKCQLCGVLRDLISTSNDSNSNSRPLSTASLKDSIARLKFQSSQTHLTSNSSPDLSLSSSKSDSIPIANPNVNGNIQTGIGIACPICTFSNHPSMIKCEICDSPLSSETTATSPSNGLSISTSSRQRTISNTIDASLDRSTSNAEIMTSSSLGRSSTMPTSSPPIQSPDSVKLSFRKGGDKAFYNVVKRTLQAKAWLRLEDSKPQLNSNRSRLNSTSSNRIIGSNQSVDFDGRSQFGSVSNGNGSGNGNGKRVGIEGILSSVDDFTKTRDQSMNSALKDLETLMKKPNKW